jgi:hypothetical protein
MSRVRPLVLCYLFCFFWKSSVCLEFSVFKWLALLVSWKFELWQDANQNAMAQDQLSHDRDSNSYVESFKVNFNVISLTTNGAHMRHRF